MFIGKKNIGTIDLKSDKFLFKHRLALGEVLKKTKDSELIQGIIYALYDVKISPNKYTKVYRHIKEVINDYMFWIEKEKQLEYTPTAEEQRAGLNQIKEKLQDFATVDAIAKRMHISHDEALKLPYSTVFLMLQSDLEYSKFERRLSKIYEQKNKRK